MRLDGDMYSSTMDALTICIRSCRRAGFCIIDDYALKGCRQAVDDYRAQHGITAPMEWIDSASGFWRH